MESYQITVVDAIRTLYYRAIEYIPSLIAAIIVLILGWLVAIFLSKAVRKGLEIIRIDHLADSLGMKTLSQRVGRDLSLAKLGEWIVKWFFFLASFIAAAEILGLSQVSEFLYTRVLTYAGNVVVAMAALLVGILAANFFGSLVESVIRAGGVNSGAALGSLTRWAIIVFAAIAALAQLGLATTFLEDLFRAAVAMLAIAGGIAFGLGGRDHAKKILDSVEGQLTKRS